MSHPPLLLHFSQSAEPAPRSVRDFAARHGHEILNFRTPAELIGRVGRAYPSAIILNGSASPGEALALCRQIKAEPFTAVVPVIMYFDGGAGATAAEALEAGADEVLVSDVSEREADLRLDLALRRAERDVSVHPTTRLPGTVQIERDFGERLKRQEKFAVCYADLDHFKEFNDRYGYNHGDRVILIVSRILRDVVRAFSRHGFIGHIGGDDFIFTVGLEDLKACCEEIVWVFDELIPLQYADEDRERGWFFGKDRRGHEYEVPLMTLSIGVVTNQQREFTHTAEISELATEMKAYAKTFPGSIYVVDRRTGKYAPPGSGSPTE